jgi:hypothetical protein
MRELYANKDYQGSLPTLYAAFADLIAERDGNPGAAEDPDVSLPTPLYLFSNSVSSFR